MRRTHRAWPVLLAVLLIVLAGCDGGHRTAAHRTAAHRTTTPTPSAPAKPPLTDADNTRSASRAAARVLGYVRVPDGSRHLARRPRGLPRSAWFVGGSSRTSWYSVPLDRSRLGRFLRDNPPRHMRADGSSGESPYTSSIEFALRRPLHPARFSAPTLLVTYGDLDGHAVMAVQVYIQARHPRPAESVVGSGVTSIDVVRTGVTGVTVSGKRPVPVELTITSPSRIAYLTRAVNRMYGSYLTLPEGSCPFPGRPPLSYSLTFHSPGTVLGFSWQPGCFGQVTVTRDGTRLPTTLEPGRASEAVTRVIAAARAG